MSCSKSKLHYQYWALSVREHPEMCDWYGLKYTLRIFPLSCKIIPSDFISNEESFLMSPKFFQWYRNSCFSLGGTVGDKVGAHKDENVSCVTRQRWRNILAAGNCSDQTVAASGHSRPGHPLCFALWWHMKSNGFGFTGCQLVILDEDDGAASARKISSDCTFESRGGAPTISTPAPGSPTACGQTGKKVFFGRA